MPITRRALLVAGNPGESTIDNANLRIFRSKMDIKVLKDIKRFLRGVESPLD